MKKINIIYSFFAFLLAFSACKEVGVDPLPMEPKGPEILSPTGSNTYTLVTENDNGAFETFIWEEAYFSDDAMVEYTVELDLATGDFSQSTILGKTEMHAYKTTVKEMNQICRDLGIIAGVPTGLQLRIKAQVNEEVKYSIPVSFLVDRYIYDDEVATWMVVGTGLENPVALMLDEESGLWKSEEPIQMIEGGFSFKNNNVYQDELFSENELVHSSEMTGNLVEEGGYMIPSMDTKYEVELDLENNTFKVSEFAYPTELYMTGGDLNGIGDDAGWNWDTNYSTFKAVHSHPELFWTIVWLDPTAGSGFKIAPERGWGNDFGTDGDATNGVWAMGGDNIKVPNAGYYIVVADFDNNTIEANPPKVYGMGNAFGGDWVPSDSDNLFTVDNTNKVIKFEGIPGDGDLRMHVAASTLVCEWWQAEVNLDPTTDDIVYREAGGDPAEYPVTTGSTITLDFVAETGNITN